MTDPQIFIPQDPNFEARVRSSFARQRVMSFLGAALHRVEPGFCEIGLPFRVELSQQHGYFHAGITSAIGDSAGGYAAYTLMPADSSVLTVEYKINLVAPADGERLIARARVIRPGRTLFVCRFEVFAVRNGMERACAEALQTVMCLPGRSDKETSP